MEFPNLTDWATFIDSIKNVVFALIFVIAGFYVTVTPGISENFAGQWVGAAMMAAGVYIGQRAEKGKQEAALAQAVALETAKNP
jgi:hypothetical protein